MEKINKKNWRIFKKAIKESLLHSDWGQDYYYIYEDPHEATGKIYMGEKKTYLQIINIFLKEIESNLEIYLLDDLQNPICDLTKDICVCQEIDGKMFCTFDYINMDNFDKKFYEVIDKHILK